MYYFFLPGFDCLRLCVPIQLPIIDPEMNEFNRNYVWTVIKNFKEQPLVVQRDVLTLMNRCKFGFSTLSDIKFQINKNTNIFTRLLLATQDYFIQATKVIQLFYRKLQEKRKLKNQLTLLYVKIRKSKLILKNFLQLHILPKVKVNIFVKKESAITIFDWYKKVKKSLAIKKYANRMKLELKLLEKRCMRKNQILMENYTSTINNEKEILRKKLKELEDKMVTDIKAKEQIKKEKNNNKKIKKEINETQLNQYDNKSSKWFGFNLNSSLKRLILGTGETLNILNIKDVVFKSQEYWRVKECLANICMITHSRQYIKFCRSLSDTRFEKKQNETIEDFLKCYCPGSVRHIDYLTEAFKISSICNNKWKSYLMNNFSEIEKLN